MNVYIFIICILVSSETDLVFGRTAYENPSYNSERDENLNALSAHQKKRLADDTAIREDQADEYEHSGPLYERFRKFEPESTQHRMEKAFDDKQKRDYYDSSGNSKDASIEVILDPRAKKAVAVLENSPNGQAMYDLTGWKKQDEAYDADQYSPTQEQVVNLVYPAERERKYGYDANSDYSEKAKVGFKDKLMSNEREDTHKRKRNADEKRSAPEKSKRKSDQALAKVDQKGASNECPPHNTPATLEDTKDGSNEGAEKEEKVKRETSQWSPEQLTALKNSLAHVKDSGGEVQNLKNILTSMGLIDEPLVEKDLLETKREAKDEAKLTEKREDTKEKLNDNKADTEDEDLNQDNIVLKRNNRETENNEDIIKAGEEAIGKREVENENNFEEEEENEEAFEEKKDVKRSNEDEAAPKEETVLDSEDEARKKRQSADVEKNLSPAESEVKTVEDSKKNAKREANSDKELRKNRENKETEEEYEKRMESQIQAKIDAIKEKVKREILEEQTKRRSKRTAGENLNTRKRRQSKEETKSKEDTKEKIENPSENSKFVRRKRANTLPEKQMVYRAYQEDQDEAEEDGEFDDNAYDARSYVEKRQADEDYYDPVRKREVENYLRQYYPESRNRRSFEAEDAFHSSRKALKNRRFSDEDMNKDNENNDSEYFGSLPQGYNGELTRYKRVKRDNPYK